MTNPPPMHSGLTPDVPRQTSDVMAGAEGTDDSGMVSMTIPHGSGKAGFLVFQFRAFYAEVRSLVEDVRLNSRAAGSSADDLTFSGLADDAARHGGDLGANQGAEPPSTGPAGGNGPPPVLAAQLGNDGKGQGPHPGAQPGAQHGFEGASPGTSSGGKQTVVTISADGVEAMVRRLAHHLEIGAGEAARLGGTYGAALYREAKYAMAALADETFIHQVDWVGRTAWRDSLVETRLYGTSIAGERLFQKIDDLLHRADPVHIELASIYLMTLTLGFKGRYRGVDEAPLEQYRRHLRAFIGRRLMLVTPEKPVFENAYAHTLDEGREQLLPIVQRWIWVVVGFVLLYLIVSHGLWLWETAPIRSIIGEG